MFYYCVKLPNYDSNYLDVTKAHANDGGYLTKVNKFYIDDVAYMIEDGMTWNQWLASEYNVDNYKSVLAATFYSSINGENPGYFICDEDGNLVLTYENVINTSIRYQLIYKDTGSHSGGAN